MKYFISILLFTLILNQNKPTSWPIINDNIQSDKLDPAKTFSKEINLEKTPAHQDIIPDKKLLTQWEKYEKEGTLDKEDEWDYQDNGRNWGWTCLNGLKQSPINIPYSSVFRSRWTQNDTTLRFHLKEILPKTKAKLTEKEFSLVVDEKEGGKMPRFKSVPLTQKKKNFGTVVVHPSFSPESAYNYVAYKFWFKTPSEHLIDMINYPLEIQVEHHLDVIKSLIYPKNAQQSKIFRKMMLVFMVKKGGLNKFIDTILQDKEKLPREVRGSNIVLDRKKAPFITDKPIKWNIKENELLMEDLFHEQTRGLPYEFNYAMYEGSYPMPPCQEDVYWIIVMKPLQATLRQLVFIDSLFNIKPSRQIQKMNGRFVIYGHYKGTDIYDTLAGNVIKDNHYPLDHPALIKNKLYGD